jgi:hypothetical protein
VKLTVSGVRGTGRTKRAKIARGAWRATLRIRLTGKAPRKVSVAAAYQGDATHSAGRAHRSIRPR